MPASDEPTADQLARLPRWARDHIAWLAMTLNEHKKRITELSAGPEDSNVFVHFYHAYPDHLLGVDTPVCFRLDTAAPGHESGIITVHHGAQPGVLEIRCGDQALHLTPQSSNALKIRIGPY